MRLLTHNMLTSHVKGVTNGYPLALRVTEMTKEEVDFSPEFVARMLPKIEWSALYAVCQQIGVAEGLPSEVPMDADSNEEFLRAAHHVLLEVQIKEGELECPESHRVFPITNGIPNMLLTEDEV